MPAAPKLHRWTDLLAALLVRKFPATFEQLAENIPAYTIEEGAGKASIMRAFERDKKELREFGVPIETVTNDIGETLGYRLSSRNFYLPYLCVVESGKVSTKPKKVDRYGYQALASLNFGPEELSALSQAAGRIRELGDPLLREDADSAIRKLAFDLPLGAAASTDEGVDRVQSRSKISDTVFEKLNDALLRKKRVTFLYGAPYSGSATEREVEPYGLFFVSSQWYLAARDIPKDGMRSFRLSRVSDVRVNSKEAQTPDFRIPSGFKLREYAASKQAWQLGDGDWMEGVVHFDSLTGDTQQAAELGSVIEATPNQRKFKVRRPDVFARWLLSFAGRAVPVAPAELVAEYKAQLSAANALYSGGADA